MFCYSLMWTPLCESLTFRACILMAHIIISQELKINIILLLILISVVHIWFSCGSDGKESVCNISGSGKCHEGGHGNPLQHSCLENPMDRGTWRATVHGFAKSQTQLSDLVHTAQYQVMLSIFSCSHLQCIYLL